MAARRILKRRLLCRRDSKSIPGSKLIHVYYSALNFKDILLATGALSYEKFASNRIMQECVIGCEFAGRDSVGTRYMGMYPAGAISTVLLASKLFIWKVPTDWSLEDAATIPVVYLTVISAFFVHGDLKRGESVLIHSGAGGVGQAAINVATHYGCTIFTTVGSPEKREFIKKTFPHIKDNHIGNSRDTTFEHLIMRETSGKGVDVVLNSLAEDKLQASVRCLAEGGRFLEIGKLDLMKDNKLGMRVFLRGVSFHCILLDNIHEEKEGKRNAILRRFQHELDAGSVKPIVRTVFENDEIEQAFRYMAAGKHIGKVLIRVRPEETKLNSLPTVLLREAVPRFTSRCEQVHILCGGMGGMGLELADWLVLRGVRKLILTSRHGITSGYQAMRINLWKTYGTTTTVTTADLSKTEEVHKLLRDAEKTGPVTGIFNLAGITEDKFFEEQDAKTFESVSTPKASITLQLDRVSRKICPNLRQFVVFSSVSSGYGNSTQTNYGFANALCERICEQRRQQGLPGLAIQWGAVGDVGMMTKVNFSEKSFGLKEQPIQSCLKMMDIFINQPEPVVTSFITADRKTDNVKTASLVETIANILGIRDLKSVSMYSPLPELGMDSISGLEIKQTLEQQHDIFLNPKEIISLTFARLEEIQKIGKKALIDATNDNNIVASIPYIRSILLSKLKSLDLSKMEIVERLPSTVKDDTKADTAFFFPPTDGIAGSMEALAKRLNVEVLCFQYIGIISDESLGKQVEGFVSYIKKRTPPSSYFNVVAFSYGVIVALEVIKALCSENRRGRVILIDGSIEFAKSLKSIYFGNRSEMHDIQTKVIIDVINSFQPSIMTAETENELKALTNWEAKLDLFLSRLPEELHYGKSNLRIITNYLYRRYESLHHYDLQLREKLNVQAYIIKAKKKMFPVPDDMGLQDYFKKTPQEYLINESHFTILDSEKTADIINNVLKEKIEL